MAKAPVAQAGHKRSAELHDQEFEVRSPTCSSDPKLKMKLMLDANGNFLLRLEIEHQHRLLRTENASCMIGENRSEYERDLDLLVIHSNIESEVWE